MSTEIERAKEYRLQHAYDPYTSIPVMESEFTAKRRRCAACACRKPVQSAKIA